MVEAKNHAEICPVCSGTGKYREIISSNTTLATTSYERTCHRM